MSCLNPFNQYLYGFNTTLVVHQRRVQNTPVCTVHVYPKVVCKLYLLKQSEIY